MKKVINIFLVLLSIIAVVLVYKVLYILNIIPKKVYNASDFNIEVVKSDNDQDNDGIDDYTDILLGARKDAINHTKYVADSYTIGGYPDDSIGVCTDVVWRAFKEAGYLLKDLVDTDIEENISLYPAVNGKPDTNIDFRRVRNLKVFFDRYALILTSDINKIK